MSIKELFTHWTYQVFAPGALLRQKYDAFKSLLAHDRRALELITELEELGHGEPRSDWARIEGLVKALRKSVEKTVKALKRMSPARYMDLEDYFRKVDFYLELAAAAPEIDVGPPYVLPLDEAWLRPELVGGKARGLSEVRVKAGLPTPDGFVVSTNAFHYLVEYNELRERQRALLRGARLDSPGGPRALAAIAEKLRRQMLQAEIPPMLRADMAEALDRLSVVSPGGGAPLFAVRSSAVGEDSEASFAGQYETELNVPPEAFLEAYKRVLAGKYSAQAIAYRIRHGLSDVETPMAVLVLPMVDAAASGVIYTRDPVASEGSRDGLCAVYAVSGLGDALVGGGLTPDVFTFDRPDGGDDPRLLGACHGEVCHVGAAAESRAADLCLSVADAQALAASAMRLETLHGRPQDVEWSRDKAGRLYVLQSRPLGSVPFSLPADQTSELPRALKDGGQVGADPAQPSRSSAPLPKSGVQGSRTPLAQESEGRVAPQPGESREGGSPLWPPEASPQADLPEPLFTGGVAASPGAGCGAVWTLASEADLDHVPQGAVLATRRLFPEIARVLERLSAVVAETGSRASHFASVAREFGLPVLTGAEGALGRLPEGEPVTVDAGRAAIFLGRVEALLAGGGRREPPDTPLGRRLRRIMPLASRLNLTDPEAENFRPSGCKSMHDFVRFCHEKSVAEMFSLVDRGGRGLSRSRELDSGLPFTMRVLDLGGGLSPDAPAEGAVRPEHLASPPMLGLWAGLSDASAAWEEGGLHFDWSAFDQVNGGGFLNPRSASLSSYAVLSADYLHCMIRFGFHFAVVDALCGPEPEANYAKFRFKGGGADFEGRLKRLGLVAWALEGAGFAVRQKGDMLDAAASRLPAADLLPRLRLLGLVLARTRLLDMAMDDEPRIDALLLDLKPRMDEILRGGPPKPVESA